MATECNCGLLKETIIRKWNYQNMGEKKKRKMAFEKNPTKQNCIFIIKLMLECNFKISSLINRYVYIVCKIVM